MIYHTNKYFKMQHHTVTKFYKTVDIRKIQFQQYEYQQTQSRRTRSRNIIWFDPLFNSNVKTNVPRNS